MLLGKNVVLGVTGGIAAYKACDVVSWLVSQGANVDVIMTEHATEFVSPLTFESLSHNPVTQRMFNSEREWEIEHVALAKKAHLVAVIPATANVIAKYAQGVADDMLSTTLLAATCPILFAPAMNTAMYLNAVVQQNLTLLRQRGVTVVEPAEGRLACGDVGKGKLAKVDDLTAAITAILTPSQDFHGKKLLITLGATAEPIDPVRFITNRSSGTFGAALTQAALNRGAQVTVIAGAHTVAIPHGAEVIDVSTTQQMFEQCMAHYQDADIIIKAAAPADYRVDNYSPSKCKDSTLTLNLVKNPDIASALGKCKGSRILVVFAAETEHLIANAKAKLSSKGADLVVANDVTVSGAGFDVPTNVVTLIDRLGNERSLPLMSKIALADVILDAVLSIK